VSSPAWPIWLCVVPGSAKMHYRDRRISTLTPSGSAVTAIDSILSTQNQQYLTVPVPAH
jgi:hypothetical protein